MNPEELEIVEQNMPPEILEPIATDIHQTRKQIDDDVCQEVFDDIFEESYAYIATDTLTTLKSRFRKLHAYEQLDEENTYFRRIFFYWLTKTVYKTQNRYKNQCKKILIELLISTDLGFEEKDYIHFIHYWKAPYYTGFPILKLLKSLEDYALTEGISTNFRNLLKNLTKRRLSKKSTPFYIEFKGIITRILKAK